MKNARMNKFLQEQDNRFEILADYLSEFGICIDDLYDSSLEERYKRALFEDLYSCNEIAIWKYLSENYNNYIKE